MSDMTSSPDLDRELLAQCIHDALTPAGPVFTWHSTSLEQDGRLVVLFETDDGETFALIGKPEPGAQMTFEPAG